MVLRWEQQKVSVVKKQTEEMIGNKTEYDSSKAMNSVSDNSCLRSRISPRTHVPLEEPEMGQSTFTQTRDFESMDVGRATWRKECESHKKQTV